MGARFEIVRTDAGWHARYVAANHRIVWWTENYGRRRGAVRAIDGFVHPLGFEVNQADTRIENWLRSNRLPIRDVDERTQP